MAALAFAPERPSPPNNLNHSPPKTAVVLVVARRLAQRRYLVAAWQPSDIHWGGAFEHITASVRRSQRDDVGFAYKAGRWL